MNSESVRVIQTLTATVTDATTLYTYLYASSIKNCKKINHVTVNLARPEFAAAAPAAQQSIDRYRLPAGPTAANPPHVAVAREWDRQTDGHRAVA